MGDAVRESLDAAVQRLLAHLFFDVTNGRISKQQGEAEIRLARRELLRALDDARLRIAGGGD